MVKRRKGLLDEEKFLPPLPEQLPRGVSSLPGYGQTSPVAQGLLGFTGRNPTYSVMSPEAQQMSDAYRLGEQASVASQLYGSVLPFAAASTMANAQRTGSLLSPLTVFHGSPHKFSKFDASKIGTGEGAQAYGHGLYFAENPAVAKEYSQRLSRNQYVDARPEIVDAEKKYFDAFNAWTKATINEKPKQEREQLKAIMDEAIKQKDEAYRLFGPQMYSVDLPDEQIAKMVNWDVSINKQPEPIKQVLLPLAQKYGVAKTADVGTLLGWMQREMPASEVSNKLKELGIPGIRYLDQGSRGKGGTSNFVVFPGEESKLRIMEVNGKPVVTNEEELRRSGLLGVSSNAPLSKELPNPGEAVEQFLLAKYPNVDISVYGKDKIHLGKIVVPKDQRNKGLGTQIMNDLVQQADEIGATVTLSPASDFGGSKERLKDFYKRFGFVQNTGRNKDFSIRESMYRIPKEKVSPETPQNEADLLAGIGTAGAGLLSPAVLEYLRRRDEEGM